MGGGVDDPGEQWLHTALKCKEIELDSRILWVPVLTQQPTIDVTTGKPFHSLSLSFFFAKPGQYYQFDLLNGILLRIIWVNSRSALKTAI